MMFGQKEAIPAQCLSFHCLLDDLFEDLSCERRIVSSRRVLSRIVRRIEPNEFDGVRPFGQRWISALGLIFHTSYTDTSSSSRSEGPADQAICRRQPGMD